MHLSKMLLSCCSPPQTIDPPDEEGQRRASPTRDVFDKTDKIIESTSPSQPDWLEDSEAPFCFQCNAQFSTSRRRHHCRRCRNIFCSTCSAQKSKILSCDLLKEVRVCGNCFIVLNEENRYIGEILPLLYAGETFKIKSMMGFSSKAVVLRLLTTGRTLVYDNDSREEPVEIPVAAIETINTTSYVTFEVAAFGKSHLFEANTKTLQQTWVHALKALVQHSSSDNLGSQVEKLRTSKKKEWTVSEKQRSDSQVEVQCVSSPPDSSVNQVREQDRQRRKGVRAQLREKYGLTHTQTRNNTLES
jgi:hypothetical protein